ncbi:hypothetical protein PENSPDRAFT_636718 [Peniophora sp. CONT]|nr:hypothetical protein PENSPDRAFT_636718 [Peniophora sp. CONT]
MAPRKTGEPTAAAAKKALKKEWEDRLRATQWAVDPTFKHASDVDTITKTRAMSMGTPKLSQLELGTLRYEQRPSRQGQNRPMHLYNYAAVLTLIEARVPFLGPPKEPKAVPRDDHLHPKDPPLIDHEYIPPPDVHPADPAPEDIIWEGENIDVPNLLLEDAMLLYCLNKEDLAHLTRKSKWLDLKTVAVLALRVHGGLRRHNEIVVARRKETRQFVEDELQRTKFKSEGQPSGHYSKYLEKVLDERPDEYYLPEECREFNPMKYKGSWGRQVKQFVPLRRVSGDEFTNDCDWYHYQVRYLDEERDMVV